MRVLFYHIVLLSMFLSLSFQLYAKSTVVKPRCEYRLNPIGIDIEVPRLSWQILSDKTDVVQYAYEIRASKSIKGLSSKKEQVWITGKIISDQSSHVEYMGEEIQSGDRIYWQVRIWDNKNSVSKWSEPAFFEIGLLNTSDWKAEWIFKGDEKLSSTSLPVQYYRNEFSVDKKVESARLYVSSLGLYQMFINGEKIGDQLFTPGFTSFKKRIQYQVYDVTDNIQSENAIGALVGDGWYRGYLGWEGVKAYYGDTLALIAQLNIEYTDGSSDVIATNSDWQVSYGSIQKSDIYNGETYDARLEPTGWLDTNFAGKQWKSASTLNHTKDILVASNSIPVKAVEEITPIKKIITPKGEIVFDLGQNIVGFARLNVRGNKGDKVTLQFAEVLDKHGNFFTTNLRSAEATDVYILSGDGEEIYEPHFTFHGFRFIKVEGYPGDPTVEDITGIVVHSAMEQTGMFTCSDTLINQLQQNIQWGQRDNFLDVPTDCPQRDERVGWTGDAQVFSMTAAFNFDVAAFYSKWLKDLSLDQQPNGVVPNIIPDMWDKKLEGTTGWADAALIVPWTVYRAYGDKRILEEQYESMKAWVDYMYRRAGESRLWNERRHHWGDWLSYDTNKPGYPGTYTETDLIATAYYKYSSELLGQIADILEKPTDAEHYSKLAEEVKDAFIKEYITPNGRLMSHTQTAYAIALSFDLVPEHIREKSSEYFAKDVQKFGHLTTGFLGTPLLCSTLSSINRDDLAFMLLNRKEYPSWLYPVTQGATTIWERWDTQKPDGTIIDGMNSFNHYAYGAIGEWLYTYVAGISIDVKNPGYKNILFHPHPGGGLTNANAKIETMYGTAQSSWTLENGTMHYTVIIPPNSTGTVTLPQSNNQTISINNKPITATVNEITNSDVGVEFNLGSGVYEINYKW